MFTLSKQDTLVLKGIAICAMLCHHLYTCPDYIGDGIIPYTGFLAWIGVLGKVCVSIFLFCSGYGLAANYTPVSFKEDLKFFSHRLIKFYLNYWVIFIIFVPITIFVFHRSLGDAYGAVNIPKRFVYDILGVQIPPYNVTWWFNKLIIIFYLLFPILYRISRIKPWTMLLVSCAIVRFSSFLPSSSVNIWWWQLPFIMGIVWKFYETKGECVQEWLEKHKTIAILSSLYLLCCMIVLRMNSIIPHWTGIGVDGFLTCSIVYCVIAIIRHMKHILVTLEFLGKHSMNIYMTHTFFNAYWNPEWLHSGEWMRGGANLIILMLICLFVSIVLEFIKEKIGLYKFINYITHNTSHIIHNT